MNDEVAVPLDTDESAARDFARRALTPQTRALLEAPVLPLLFRLAWPNILIMLAQASTGLIETWFVAKLGVDALAGMALVFPGVMLMQMISAGAMGGGISAAVARALGAGERDRADGLVLHAVVINAVLGLAFSIPVLLFGHGMYHALGGSGAALDAALQYSNVVFAGTVLLWILNAFASVIRGTGNMWVPGVVICGGAVLLIPLSPCLIFGFGPLPAMGIAGGGAALVAFYALGTIILGWYVVVGRNLARFRWVRLRWAFFRNILKVGAVGALSALQTNFVIWATTALVGAYASARAVAGYGTGARLEYLLIPLVFGVGAPLVAMVGTNIGAGQQKRALHIAMTGGWVAFAMTELIGIAAAIWPQLWLSQFGSDPVMIETGSAYLRAVGPCYGFFGLGLALYFASQGAGRLKWPLLTGLLRVVVAIGAGGAWLYFTHSLAGLFVSLGAGMVCYGVWLAALVRGGVWFKQGVVPGQAPPAQPVTALKNTARSH